MKVEQIHELLNQIAKESSGTQEITVENLDSVVDIGKALELNANSYDSFTNKLVDRIAKTIIVDKDYITQAPSDLIYKDKFEYAALVQKIRSELPESRENKGRQLQHGQEYKDFTFNQPKVNVETFSSISSFSYVLDTPLYQLKTAFLGANQMQAFISHLEKQVRKSVSRDNDRMIFSTINHFTAATIEKEFSDLANFDKKSGIRAKNLLFLYNQDKKANEKLTKENCLNNSDFLRFVVSIILKDKKMLTVYSSLFNLKNFKSSTTDSDLIIMTHFDLSNKLATELQAYAYHKELLELPSFSSVAAWQGLGTSGEFASTSKINVRFQNAEKQQKTLELGGILGVMFDKNALGILNEYQNASSDYNHVGQFYKHFYNYEISYFNDFYENFIVYFIA